MSDITKLAAKLLTLAAVAGLALGATNAVTEGPIKEQALATADAARRAVLPVATNFEPLAQDADGLTDLYRGTDAAGETAGYTAVATVQGFGGPIEVTVGVDEQGTVSGVSVGGTDFSETAGLGAKTKEPWFAAQFSGKAAPFALKKNGGNADAATSATGTAAGEEVDAVTGATISSTAVTNGVNLAAEYLASLAKEGN